ncbi:cytochrome b [Bordetella sp. BOR01]|uniref:cytochrome b n=1 Tax=Bordetella sp. BOR01 TaxID=2854779 RepID=UPI001C489651|nr:cytochrome b [Bordetella sp. BOR01]MBV7481869.1 cytochrome b [Bordetella sp. BOR01]
MHSTRTFWLDAAASAYDRTTIVLHWLTALLVVALFIMAQVWESMPHGTPVRKSLQGLHVSLGLLLTAVIVLRMAWRATGGRRLPPASHGALQVSAKTMHYALYLLLAAQIVLGFLFRWAQGESFTFFGWFSIPKLLPLVREQRHFFGDLHNVVAWVIIVLAGLHALAALFHHYWLRDGLLRRMWGGSRAGRLR